MNIQALHALFLESNGVTTDTRKIEPGQIFFALKGDRFNGNLYADQALEKGCSYAVVDEAEFANGDNKILVTDALLTLQALSAIHRKAFKGKVIGLTGSNGKTTSKELLRDVLATTYSVYATKGNLNNHIGVPLSLLEIKDTHEIAIIEMGANAQGEIRDLCLLSDPDYGFITNMGKAHLEGFGGIEGVRKGKSELYAHLRQNEGLAFVNEDDEILKQYATDLKVQYYGNASHYPQVSISKETPLLSFTWQKEGYESPEVATQLTGGYNLGNIACAVAVGDYFNVSPENINKALSSYHPDNNRSEIKETGKNTVILDCYNANPTSMEHALNSFARFDSENKLCILGDMFELGDVANEEHLKVMQLTAKLELNTLFVGELFATASPPGVQIFHTTEVLLEALRSSRLEGMTILLKGSRGMALERLMEVL